jgi:hypothetical protein
VLVSGGLLPYPYGREPNGYEVRNIKGGAGEGQGRRRGDACRALYVGGANGGYGTIPQRIHCRNSCEHGPLEVGWQSFRESFFVEPNGQA